MVLSLVFLPAAFLAMLAQVAQGTQWDVTLNTFLLVVLAVINLIQAGRIKRSGQEAKGAAEEAKEAVQNTPREVAEAIVEVLIERRVFGNGYGRREYERGG